MAQQFTKKHYVVIAALLKEADSEASPAMRAGVQIVRHKLALLFEQDSAQFKKDKFMQTSRQSNDYVPCLSCLGTGGIGHCERCNASGRV